MSDLIDHSHRIQLQEEEVSSDRDETNLAGLVALAGEAGNHAASSVVLVQGV